MMERAVLLCTGFEILPEHLMLETMSVATAPAPDLAWNAAARPTPLGLPAVDGGAGDEAERERILRVLAECGGNQSRAAKALGIARSTLVLRLNSYQVPRPRK